jgi:hypothetical protein
MFNTDWKRNYKKITMEALTFERFLKDEKSMNLLCNVEYLIFHECIFRNVYVILKVLMCCPKLKALEIVDAVINNYYITDRDHIFLMQETHFGTIEHCILVNSLNKSKKERDKLFIIIKYFMIYFKNLRKLLFVLKDTLLKGHNVAMDVLKPGDKCLQHWRCCGR